MAVHGTRERELIQGTFFTTQKQVRRKNNFKPKYVDKKDSFWGLNTYRKQAFLTGYDTQHFRHNNLTIILLIELLPNTPLSINQLKKQSTGALKSGKNEQKKFGKRRKKCILKGQKIGQKNKWVIFQFLVRKRIFTPAHLSELLYKKYLTWANLFFHSLGDKIVATLHYER